MQKHNRRALCPSRDEVAGLTEVKHPNPPELPADVVDELRRARNHFFRIAQTIEDEAYAVEWNREGIAWDCTYHAEDIQLLLEKYNYAIGDPPFYW